MQKKLLPHNKSYCNIPDVVYNFCLLFYFQTDKCDKNAIGNGLILKEDNNIIEHCGVKNFILIEL